VNCGLCERDIETGYLCESDTRSLAGRLATLPGLYAELAVHLVPRCTGPTELVRAATAGPRSPLNEDVLDLVQGRHMVTVMESWREDVQRVRWPQHTPPPPAGLASACRWLAMELDWIVAHYPAAGDLAREVRGLEGQARTIVGDPPPRPQRLGLCIAVTDDKGTVCGAVISRMPGDTQLICRWCGTEYGPGQYLTLKAFQPADSP
jgi:hypothetical protein